ncbi:acyl carrier protein [Amycolatopsis sp. NBC_00345]|uniref:acyl carrier protein n=1 Tax=Amycolatopsis sp. NBC_00345 TaxID=2975955 RepID=UPI002E271C57
MNPRPSDLTSLVAARFGEVLGVSPETAREAPSLFDLPGFDSVAVVAVLERLEDELGVEVPPELIVPEAFESVAALTEILRTIREPTNSGGVR